MHHACAEAEENTKTAALSPINNKQSDLASVVLFSTVAVKMGFNFDSLVIRRQFEGIFNYREKALKKIFGKGDVHSLP